MIELESRNGQRRQRRSVMLIGTVILAVWLLGCVNTGGVNLESSEPPGESEPPAVTGGSVTPDPRALTTTPELGTGGDQPVSPNQNVTPQTSAPNATTRATSSRPHITGHVAGPDNVRIPGAVVMIVKGTGEYPERTYRTDDTGKYTIFVPPGHYTVAVNASSFKMAQQEVEVTADAEAILDFQLEAE